MEANLCLRPHRAPTAIKPHCLLTTRQRFRAKLPAFHRNAFSSVLSNGGSIKPDLNHLHKLISAYNVPPPPPPRILGNGRARIVAVAGAGVVLACFIGVLCSKMKHGDHALAVWGFPPSSMSQSQSPPSSDESSAAKKSVNILKEILLSRQRGDNSMPEILLSSLRMEVGEAKLEDYPELLERKLKETVGGEEKLHLNFLLFDVYLQQGNYDKANAICKRLEVASKFDSRYKYRKEIIERWCELKRQNEKIIAEKVLKRIEGRKPKDDGEPDDMDQPKVDGGLDDMHTPNIED